MATRFITKTRVAARRRSRRPCHNLGPMAETSVVDPSVLSTARSWVHAAKAIVVLTGAGISTDSGIPDFRGPNGRLDQEPEGRAHLPHRPLRGRPRGPAPVVAAAAAPPGLDGRAQRRPPGARRARAAGQAARRSSPRTSTGCTWPPGTEPDAASSRCTAPCARSCASSCDERAPMRAGARPGASRRGRSAVPELWRDAQVGHRVVRPVARSRRPATGPTERRASVPTCCWPSARRSPSIPWPTCPASPQAPARRLVIVNGEPTAYRRARPTRCCAARSATSCRRWSTPS